MTLRILHFRYPSYQERYFTVFNNYNYIYYSLYYTECKNEENKILLGLEVQ